MLCAPPQVAAAQLGAAKQLGPLRALHFQPSGWPHVVTAVLPLPPTASAAAEDALQGRRLQLHRRLSAFASRPLLCLQPFFSGERLAAFRGGRLPMTGWIL